MEYVSVDNLKEGIRVAQNIHDSQGRLLVGCGSRLTSVLIARLRILGVSDIYVESDESKGILTSAAISDSSQIKSVTALNAVDVDKIASNAASLVMELGSSLLDTDMNSISLYDTVTAQHSLNVAIYAVVMAKALGFDDTRTGQLAQAGMLHDIGKLLVPKEIIQKPGKLTDMEREEIKKHSQLGYDLLKERWDIWSVVRVGVLEHHETENGNGYPSGLMGSKIHDFAKILHVADVYDALIAKRSYKESWSSQKAMKYLEDNKGILFSPEVVDVFKKVVPVYRKGSSVTLNTGQEAIIVKNIMSALDRPIIRLRDSGKEVDLRDSDLEIVKSD